MKILKYLISGVVVGAVLFFAGFGIMNMMEESQVEVTRTTTAVAPVPAPVQTEITKPTVEVIPPAIEVNSTNQEAQTQTAQNGEGTSSSPIKIKPLGSAEETEAAAEQVNKPLAFGTLTLSTVNSVNGQATSADFLIENSEGAAIALVKNTESSTLSLPAGNYKISVSQGAAKLVRFLGVKEGQNGSEVFELDVPVLAEETPAVSPSTPAVVVATPAVQAPAAVTPQQTTPAQTAETPAEATQQQVDAAELASDDPKADGVDKPAKEASDEVTVTSQASGSTAALGGLRVSALTKVGNRPTNASFYIQKLNGENIENVKGVSTQQFNLPAGKYRITARKGTARVVTEVTVVANRGSHEIFHIPEVPTSTPASTTTATSAPVRQTPPAVVVPPAPARPSTVSTRPAVVATPATPAAKPDAKDEKTGKLELFSQAASNNKAIKSNFYVQTIAGKLVTNKTYVDSIGYKLPPGKYKVTVRATGYADKTVQLNVRAGQVRREVFKMTTKRAAPAAVPMIPAPVTQAPATVPVQQQAEPAVRPAQNQAQAARRGGLQINIVSAETGQGLIADISVHRPNGREVRRSNQSSTARYNLPPREFVIRINYGGLVTNQKVKIRTGKLAIKTITFKQAN